MPELVSLDFVRNRRSRANDAHVAHQNVEQLRHFIETRAPQKSSRPRDAWIREQFVSWFLWVAEVCFGAAGDERALILAMQFGISVRDHRAKLVKQEQAAIHADALLRVEHGASRIKLDEQRQQEPQWQKQQHH